MTRPGAVVHWLRENAQSRSPHRVLVVDTETRPLTPDNEAEQVLRLWCARLIRRHGLEPDLPRTADLAGETAESLVALVERCARADHTLWLYTHNLNFDLAVTALPARLAERGWQITESALTTDDPWCRLTRGNRRIAIVDSWSFLPTSVEAIGELVGIPKVPLPSWEADDSLWRDRCAQDVAIVANALESLMEWWDAGQYGNWSLTGPATGWSSYRHRKPVPKVLVDPDVVARTLEARAVSGGRRDVWRIGRQPDGLYADLDITTAHLQVMTSRPLPMRRLRAFDSLGLDAHELRSGVLDVLAEVEINTASPRYPWDSGRGIFYPVGRFRTVLAGPDLRSALARGELRSIGRGYVYVLSSHMVEWATWVASLLAVETPDVPPAVRLLAKHWSRCVPGKWAGHTSETLSRIADPRPGWQVERGWIVDGHRPADWLRIGGQLWTIARDEWADDAFPAILAWIQAHTRVAMNALVDALGSAVITCNTDGLLVNARVATGWPGGSGDGRTDTDLQMLRQLDSICQSLDTIIAPFSVRIKGAARRVTVISPQHVILDQERRLSGIPKRAVDLGGGRYRFTQWPKLRVQLAKERPPGYTVRTATVDLAHVPPAGWLNLAGIVAPIRLASNPDGTTEIDLPDYPYSDHGGLAPRERQHPRLRPLLALEAAA